MDGTPFTIGEREFIVPRLRVLAWEKAIGDCRAIDSEPDPVRKMDAVFAIVADLLRPNYPDLTGADVKATAYIDEWKSMVEGIIAAGGKRPPAPGEGVSP